MLFPRAGEAGGTCGSRCRCSHAVAGRSHDPMAIKAQAAERSSMRTRARSSGRAGGGPLPARGDHERPWTARPTGAPEGPSRSGASGHDRLGDLRSELGARLGDAVVVAKVAGRRLHRSCRVGGRSALTPAVSSPRPTLGVAPRCLPSRLVAASARAVADLTRTGTRSVVHELALLSRCADRSPIQHGHRSRSGVLPLLKSGTEQPDCRIPRFKEECAEGAALAAIVAARRVFRRGW